MSEQEPKLNIALVSLGTRFSPHHYYSAAVNQYEMQIRMLSLCLESEASELMALAQQRAKFLAGESTFTTHEALKIVADSVIQRIAAGISLSDVAEWLKTTKTFTAPTLSTGMIAAYPPTA